MHIRPAQLADAPGLAEQVKAVADEGRWIATQSDRSVEELDAMFRSSIEAGHLLFVLEHEGRVVGAIGIHPTGVEGVHSMGMSILREHRGQGRGRQLVETALDAARAQGIRKVELEVFTDNAPAIALYISSGFEIEGVRRDHYLRLDGSLRSAVLMAMILEAAPLGSG